MTSSLRLLCVTLLACACGRELPTGPLANAARKGLTCTTIEEVFALDPSEIDLGTAFLLADREVDPSVDVAACTRHLDQLAREFLSECDPGEPIEDTLEHLVETASEAPLSGDEIVYEYRQLRLARVIEQATGNCVSLSALYLAIAERAGFELDGVLLPYHFKVRHEGSAGVYEIETTSSRVSRGPDDKVGRYFSERDRSSSRFGQALSPRETLASYVAQTGQQLHWVGLSARGLALCQLAIAAWPDLVTAYAFTGEIETDLDATSGKGIAAYRRALEIRPDDAYVWFSLGIAYARSGSCALAIEPFWRALELNPELAPAWLQLAEAQLNEGALEDALGACRSAREVRREGMHYLDAVVIGDYRRFEAATYRTEGDLYQAFSRRTTVGMEPSEALLHEVRWHALSLLCMTMASPEVYPLEAGQWAYQTATEKLRSHAPFASDQTLIDLEKAAAAHLKALDAE